MQKKKMVFTKILAAQLFSTLIIIRNVSKASNQMIMQKILLLNCKINNILKYLNRK